MPFDGEVLEGEIVDDGGPCVRVIVLYNVLEPSNREIVELDWFEGRTLDQYMSGLPSDVTWSVCTSKGVIPVENWSDTVLAQDERLVLTMTPGGSMGKILMLVAMVALAIFAPYLGGILGPMAAASFGFGTAAVWGSVIGGLVMALGGILISMLMPKPEVANNKNSTACPGDYFCCRSMAIP